MKNMNWKNLFIFVAGLTMFLMIAAVSIPNAPHRNYLAGLAADYLYKIDGSFGFYVQDVINHLLNTSNPHSTTASQVGAVAANNAITGATKTKLTYDTKGLITSGTDATTADIADSANKRYVTDAQATVLGNTSGTNSGDETAARIGVIISTASTKSTPSNSDLFSYANSEAANILVKWTWAQIKNALRSYLDDYYATGTIPVAATGAEINTGTDIAKFATPKAIADSNITRQGNTFNGNSQLLQLTADGKYPALDGSGITNLPSGFANPMTAVGDLIIGGTAGAATAFPKGTALQIPHVKSDGSTLEYFTFLLGSIAPATGSDKGKYAYSDPDTGAWTFNTPSGAGDMVLANNETVTGAKTYNPDKLIVAGSTSGTIKINAPAEAGTNTVTLPAATDTLVGKATTDTLTNKTLTVPEITGDILFNQTTTPSTPSTGKNKLYFKSDKKLYKLDSDGNETEAGSGGGDALPSQTGNAGKFLTTDGSTASWGNIISAPINVTSGTRNITVADNGAIFSNYGATGDVTLSLDSRENLGNAFGINVLNEATNPLWQYVVGQWHLSEASGSRANSITGGSSLLQDGTVGSATDAVFGTVASFSGSPNSLYRHSLGASERLGSTFTISMWIKPSSVTGAKPFLCISNDSGTFTLLAYLYSNLISVYGYGGYQTFSTTNEVNVWYNFIFSYGDGKLKVYKNGAVIGSDYTYTHNTSYNTRITLGWDFDASYYEGKMREVICLNGVAVTASQALEYYNAGAGTALHSAKITVSPASTDRLHGTASNGSSLSSSAKGNLIKLRTASALYDIYQESIVGTWTDMMDEQTTALIDSCPVYGTINPNGISIGYGIDLYGAAQCISVSGTRSISKIKLYLAKNTGTTGNATLKIYAVSGSVGTTGKPTGSALATSDTILDTSTLSSDFQLVDFDFNTPYSASGNIAIAIEFPGSYTNRLKVGYRDAAHPGDAAVKIDQGWTEFENPYYDLIFYAYEQ